MNTPAQAMPWYITWRSRWGLLAIVAYLLLAVTLVHTLPASLNIGVGDNNVPAVSWYLGMPCVFIMILLVAVFSMTGNDAADSGLTRHMFVLTVRTTTLVAWPMFSGCLAVAALWWITAGLVFRPGGIAAPLWLPAASIPCFWRCFRP